MMDAEMYAYVIEALFDICVLYQCFYINRARYSIWFPGRSQCMIAQK